MTGAATAFAGAVVGAVMLVCCGWTSYVIACRWTRTAPTSVRWSAAAVVALWLLVAVFLVLAWASLFQRWVAVGVWAAACALTHARLGGHDAAAQLPMDLRALGRALASVPRGFQALLAALALVAAARTARGLVAPPLAWDALTYHLLKAGRWVQAGAFAPEAAPDAWGYYEYFVPYGDVIWAWAMLPVHGDALLAPAGLLVWLALLLGAYAAACALGASRRWALVGAAVIGSLPSVMNYLTTAYVENLTVAVFLLGAVFVTRAVRGADRPAFVLGAAALGVGAGVKIVSLPYLVVGFSILALAIARSSAPKRDRWALLAGCVLAAAIAVPPYARAWVERGSPIYPVGVAVGGRVVASGNEEMELLHSGRLLPAHRTPSLIDAAERLIRPDPLDLFVGVEFTRLGPAPLFLLLLAPLGAIVLLRRPEDRLPVVYLVAAAAIAVASILTESSTALRGFWLDVLGRHLLVPVAVVAVLAVVTTGRVVGAALACALVVNLALVIPIGWSPLDVAAMPLLGAWALWAFMLALVAAYARRRRQLATAALPLVVLLMLPYAAVLERRRESRYTYYELASRREVYDLHPLDPAASAPWPVWRALDVEPGATIAATAGWDGVGHNWYRYPLLGSRLQNRVVYVPITRDGEIVDYRDAAAARDRADFDVWLGRLVALEVDYVAVLPPDPIEADWVRRHPELFSVVAAGQGNKGGLYRLERGP